jgi:hypothetical protein
MPLHLFDQATGRLVPTTPLHSRQLIGQITAQSPVRNLRSFCSRVAVKSPGCLGDVRGVFAPLFVESESDELPVLGEVLPGLPGTLYRRKRTIKSVTSAGRSCCTQCSVFVSSTFLVSPGIVSSRAVNATTTLQMSRTTVSCAATASRS